MDAHGQDEEFPEISRVIADLRRTFNRGKTQCLEWRRGKPPFLGFPPSLDDHWTKTVSWVICAAQLKKLRDLITENEEQIVEALQQDLGRCRMETVLSEISTTIGEVDLALRHLKVPRKAWGVF